MARSNQETQDYKRARQYRGYLSNHPGIGRRETTTQSTGSGWGQLGQAYPWQKLHSPEAHGLLALPDRWTQHASTPDARGIARRAKGRKTDPRTQGRVCGQKISAG